MELSYRTFEIETKEEGRLSGIASTQAPVPMLDRERNAIIPEVLVMSGAMLPTSGRVPLLDSHNRRSVKDQLGSARLYVQGDQLIAEPEISSARQDVRTLVDEGHLKGLSIGYGISERHYIAPNKTLEHEGRSYQGPLNLVTRFNVHELSLTPIGADPNAKLRSEEISEPELIHKGEDRPQGDLTRNMETNETPQEQTAPEQTRAEPTVDVEKIVADRLAAELQRSRDIRDECKRQGLQDHADELIDSCKTVDEANRRILGLIASNQKRVSPVLLSGRSHRDKSIDAFRSGLLCRTLGQARFEKAVKPEDRATGWEQTRNLRLIDIARQCLELEGENTRYMGDHEVTKRAMFSQKISSRADTGDLAYLTTGSFPSLLLDAINKNLLEAYQEAPATWRTVFRVGPSARDLKTLYRIRGSAVSNIDIWAENQTPNQLKISDKKESYKVERYGNQITIDQHTIINDDLDFLSRVPSLMGAACARTVNATAWAQVTSNPNLSDGIAFFHSSHNNLLGSGAAPSTAQLNTMRATMRKQTGMAGEKLNPTPRLLVVPAALESTARQLVHSEYDFTANVFMGYNPQADLTVVCEPLLDDTSAVQYYLMGADQEAIGEVTFLQGYEQPFVNSSVNMQTLRHEFLIEQFWGAALIDYQYAVKNPGQ
jgi:phage major head subunit gpT-like protein